MLGRFRFYFQRAAGVVKTKGLSAALRESGDFLLRRKFFLGFALEEIEQGLLSRTRGIQGTVLASHKFREFGPRLLVYVGFDRKSVLQPHVINQLRFFKDQGYTAVFVSTSPSLPPEALRELEPLVAQAIHRRNEGYDFVSYRVGFEAIADLVPAAKSLVVMNDSCFGPLYDFSADLRKMEEDTGAVWGLTISHEIRRYIQSYFFHYGEELLKARIPHRYFRRVRILQQKPAIVRYYEIGGSAWLEKRAVPLRALVDPMDPAVGEYLKSVGLTDPTRDPAATEFHARRMLPLRKRSLG